MSCKDDADLTLWYYTVLAGKPSNGNSCFSVKTQILTADVFPASSSLNRVFRDTISTAEMVAFHLSTVIADTVEIAESDILIFLNDKTLSDALVMQEAFIPVVDWHRAFSDDVGLDDAVAILFSPGAFADAVAVPDSVKLKVTKVFADTVFMQEAVSVGGRANPADTSTVTDHGTLLNQGYFDHTGNPLGYFADDYFGDKRSW